MNYIYDIIVNFNTYAFDFYDWNDSDRLTHLRKIPIFKTDTNTLNDIIQNDVSFNASFLEQIKDKTEIFTNKNVKIIPYSFLLCDGAMVIAIKVDKNRLFKSKLLLDEEDEVLDVCGKFKEQPIAFTIKKKNYMDNYVTRKQMNLVKKIDKMINDTYKNKDYDTLRYIYYDCFNKKNDDIENIMKQLNQKIQSFDHEVLTSIEKFYKLLEIKK